MKTIKTVKTSVAGLVGLGEKIKVEVGKLDAREKECLVEKSRAAWENVLKWERVTLSTREIQRNNFAQFRNPLRKLLEYILN